MRRSLLLIVTTAIVGFTGVASAQSEPKGRAIGVYVCEHQFPGNSWNTPAEAWQAGTGNPKKTFDDIVANGGTIHEYNPPNGERRQPRNVGELLIAHCGNTDFSAGNPN